jgi:ferredoxin
VSVRLRVNPIACEAHGMCAELLPEAISLDEWGYPIVDGRPLPADLLAHAERAAAACPTFALLLERRKDAHPRRREQAPEPSAPVRRRVPRPPAQPRA